MPNRKVRKTRGAQTQAVPASSHKACKNALESTSQSARQKSDKLNKATSKSTPNLVQPISRDLQTSEPTKYNLRPRRAPQEESQVINKTQQGNKKPGRSGKHQNTTLQTSRREKEISGSHLNEGNAAPDQRIPIEETALTSPVDPEERFLPNLTAPIPLYTNGSVPRRSETPSVSPFIRAAGYEPDDPSEMGSQAFSTKSYQNRDRYVRLNKDNPNFDRAMSARFIGLEAEFVFEPQNWQPKTFAQDLCQRIILAKKFDASDHDDKRWTQDLNKAGKSYEAIFQHTIMIEVINRSQLNEKLDYMCDGEWKCHLIRPNKSDPLGTKENPDITKPKPDLMVAFKAKEFISSSIIQDLGDLEGFLSPEGQSMEGERRAFPFFLMEVKGSLGDIGGVKAARQAVSSASQALYNIWQFCCTDFLQSVFFEKVRVFSATGDGNAFILRMHYAKRRMKGKNLENCPLSYQHEWVGGQIKGSEYTRRKILGRIKIVLEYGIKELLPILQDMVNATLNIKYAEEEAQSTKVATGSTERDMTPTQSSIMKRTAASQESHEANGIQSSKRQALGSSFSSTSRLLGKATLEDEDHIVRN